MNLLRVSLSERNSCTQLPDTTACHQSGFELCIKLVAGLIPLLCLDVNALNMHVERAQAPVLFRGIASAVAADAELVGTCRYMQHVYLLAWPQCLRKALQQLSLLGRIRTHVSDQWTRITVTCLRQRGDLR